MPFGRRPWMASIASSYTSDCTEGTRKCGNNLHFLTVLPSETIINHDRKNVEAILAGETLSACEQH